VVGGNILHQFDKQGQISFKPFSGHAAGHNPRHGEAFFLQPFDQRLRAVFGQRARVANRNGVPAIALFQPTQGILDNSLFPGRVLPDLALHRRIVVVLLPVARLHVAALEPGPAAGLLRRGVNAARPQRFHQARIQRFFTNGQDGSSLPGFGAASPRLFRPAPGADYRMSGQAATGPPGPDAWKAW